MRAPELVGLFNEPAAGEGAPSTVSHCYDTMTDTPTPDKGNDTLPRNRPPTDQKAAITPDELGTLTRTYQADDDLVIADFPDGQTITQAWARASTTVEVMR